MKKVVSFFLKKEIQEKIVALGIFGILVLLLLPMLHIAKYDVMSVDDYMYLNIAQNGLQEGQGFFEVLLVQAKNAYDCWSTWQGQYFVNWLIMVFLAVFGPENYSLVIVVTLFPMLLAEFYLAYIILKKGMGASFAQVCIVIFPIMILHISTPLALVEFCYWLSGAITYTTTYAISLWAIGLLANLFIEKEQKKIKVAISEFVLLILAVCLGGSNFVTGLFMVLVFCLFMVYALWKKHPRRMFCCVLLAINIACFLITALSPGATNRRMENAEAQVPALEAIMNSLVKAAEFISCWTMPFVIWLMVFMIPVFWKIIRNKNYKFPLPALVLVISFGMYAAQFTPNQYALGILGAYRVQNIYRFQMLFFLLGNEFYILGYLHRRFPQLKIPGAGKICKLPFASVLYGIVACGFVFWLMVHNVGNTLSSISTYDSLRDGSAVAYYREYEARLAVLEDDTVKDVVFQPYQNKPYALFFDDFKRDNEWINLDTAEYYNKNSIRLDVKE